MTDFIREQIARENAAYARMVARAAATISTIRNAEILADRIAREEIRIGNSLDRMEGAL